MRAVVVAGVVALSSLAAADPATTIPVPTALVAKPLEVGQWVSYRELTKQGEVGTVLLVVVNRADCGMQFEAVLAGTATKRWIFCVDDDHRLVKAALDGKPVVLHEHLTELGALLTRVLPPQYVGELTREDVSVPAGTFEGAQRKAGATTTWLHPDVPLGGVVRVKQGDREDVLVAYGARGSTVDMPMPGDAARARRRPTFMDIGAGLAGLSGMDAGRSGTADWGVVGLGFVFSRHFDGLVSVSGGDTSRSDGDPMLATKTIDVTFGPRWWPYRETLGPHRFFDPASLFVQLTAGYSRIDKTDSFGNEDIGNGLAMSAVVGWQAQLMRDWSVAWSVFDTGAVYNGSSGPRNAVGVAATIELWIQ